MSHDTSSCNFSISCGLWPGADEKTMNDTLSVIIPVLNEAQIINTTIDHLGRLNFTGDLEVIVADGDSQGSTINAIKHPGVKKVISKTGRGAQMNNGAAIAGGDILLFLHADTLLGPDALNQIVATIQNPEVVGGAFDLEIGCDKKMYRWIEAAASIRSRLTGIPYGDQAIFIKKRCFERLGGFKEIPLMEDVELMRRIKKNSLKIRFVRQKVRTASRRWEKEGIVYCTLRNWILITLYLLGISPEKLKKFYYPN